MPRPAGSSIRFLCAGCRTKALPLGSTDGTAGRICAGCVRKLARPADEPEVPSDVRYAVDAAEAELAFVRLGLGRYEAPAQTCAARATAPAVAPVAPPPALPPALAPALAPAIAPGDRWRFVAAGRTAVVLRLAGAEVAVELLPDRGDPFAPRRPERLTVPAAVLLEHADRLPSPGA